MARTNRRTNSTRKSRIDEGKPTPRPKFVANQQGETEGTFCTQQALPQFTAANERQRTALKHLNQETPFVFLRGASGTGKSMIAVYRAAKLLKEKRVDKIWLVRPAVLCGNTIGLLKGDLNQKMRPFFRQTLIHLEHFMGKAFVNYCLEKEVIEFFPFEYIRGMSLEGCIVIAEECQNLDHSEFETMLTRRGKSSQIIFTGDEKQKDLKGTSGLTSTIDMISKVIEQQPDYLDDDDLDNLEEGIAVVTFLPEDNMRSGVTKALSKIYHYS